MSKSKPEPTRKVRRRAIKLNALKKRGIKANQERKEARRAALKAAESHTPHEAVQVLQEIQDGILDAKDLTHQQRRACLVLLYMGAYSKPQLAALFKVSQYTIHKDLRHIETKLATSAEGLTTVIAVAQTEATADICRAGAMKLKDYGLAWTIQRDRIKVLKDLGVIGDRNQPGTVLDLLANMAVNYERAREKLSRGMKLNPTLSGEVTTIDSTSHKGISLPLQRGLIAPEEPGQPDTDETDQEE